MPTSQNGWPVLARNELRWFTAAAGRFAAANTAVAEIAAYLITRFDAEVEPIEGPVLDDWSYANRPVTGGKVPSNHASATAWDLNALRHPRGAKGTYSMRQETAVMKILDSITDNAGRPIIRWGEHYEHATVDGMHFELVATPAQAQQARIRLENAKMQVTDITPEAADQIADALLTRDRIPNDDPANPFWRFDSVAARTKRNTDLIPQLLVAVKNLSDAQGSLVATLAAIGDQLAAIAERLPQPPQ
jgi:hypothetical protein